MRKGSSLVLQQLLPHPVNILELGLISLWSLHLSPDYYSHVQESSVCPRSKLMPNPWSQEGVARTDTVWEWGKKWLNSKTKKKMDSKYCIKYLRVPQILAVHSMVIFSHNHIYFILHLIITTCKCSIFTQMLDTCLKMMFTLWNYVLTFNLVFIYYLRIIVFPLLYSL